MKTLLFVAYGGGHINMIIPIYDQLKSRPEFQIKILALTTAGSRLKELGIPFYSYKDFIHLFSSQALEFGRILSRSISENSRVPLEESISYLGINFLELVNKVGLEKAERLYADVGRKAFLPVQAMETFFDVLKPDLVVTTSSPRSERAALLAAKNRKIKSICLIDIFDQNDMQPIVELGVADEVCVLNDYAKNMMNKLGRQEHVTVTGNPAFDRIFDTVHKINADKYRQQHAITSQKVILWARSFLPEDEKLSLDIEGRLKKFAKNNKNYFVILRRHPNDIFNTTEQISESCPENFLISAKDDPIYTLLHVADLVYTLYSTVGIEAHLLGKIVLQQTNTKLFPKFNLIESNGAYGIDDASELETTLKRITMKPRHSVNTIDLASAAENISAIIDLAIKTDG
jgi:hypothetical protein